MAMVRSPPSMCYWIFGQRKKPRKRSVFKAFSMAAGEGFELLKVQKTEIN